MNGPAAAARTALLGIIARTLTGRGITEAEKEKLASDMALSGFRKTARGLLVRRMMGAALESGPVTILAPALDGLFTIACPAMDFGVGWEILEHGTYEPHLVAYYRTVLEPGMTVLDVGANIGFHALHAAALVGPSGSVYAVEPDPENVAHLTMSLALPGAPGPVTVIEAGLSDEAGELVHTDLGNAANSGARFTGKSRGKLESLVHGAAPRFRTVRALRWDDAYPDARLDVVKIDIEGFEPCAIRGMRQVLERDRPLVITEFAPDNLASLGETDPRDYLRWFTTRDYRIHVIEEPSGAVRGVDEEGALRAVAGRHHVDLAMVPNGPV